MPLLYTIIIYFMCGFAPDVNAFFWCYLINVFIATACTGYGYFISALARNVKEANTIGKKLALKKTTKRAKQRKVFLSMKIK